MLTELNWRRLQVLGLLVAGEITGGECIEVISPALNSALHTSGSSFNKGCLSNYKGEISVYGNKSSSKRRLMNRLLTCFKFKQNISDGFNIFNEKQAKYA